jgi:hypothetical protein
MILSNDGIKRALEQGALEISPVPDETQYTTSAVDLYLGEEFNVWDTKKLQLSGDAAGGGAIAADCTGEGGVGQYTKKPGARRSRRTPGLCI